MAHLRARAIHARRPLGRTGLSVTPIGFGTAALGDMPEAFGFGVAEERALATLRAALASPVNLIDTAAIYGDGRSESRIGTVLAEVGAGEVVVSTKADRNPAGNDFSPAQMRRSVEGSLQRLGLGNLPLVHLHDPEHGEFDVLAGPGGAVEELVRMREEGIIGALGLAGGPVRLMQRYLELGVFDVLVTHNRWTLLDRSADRLITRATAMGLGVLNAAPFGSGLLTGDPARDRYGYRVAAEGFRERAQAMAAICARYGTTLAAAALQFSVRDPRITSTIVGATRAERVAQVVELYEAEVPDAIWPELDDLAVPQGDERLDRW